MALPVNRGGQQNNPVPRPKNTGIPKQPMTGIPKQPNIPLQQNPQQQGRNPQQQRPQQGQVRQNPQQQGVQQGQQQGPYNQGNRPGSPQQQQGRPVGQERPQIPSNRPTLSNEPGKRPEGLVGMGAEYDYEGQAAKFKNIYDEEEPFETLSVDQQLEEDGNPFEDVDTFNQPLPVNSQQEPALSMPDDDIFAGDELDLEGSGFGDDKDDILNDIEEQFSTKRKQKSGSERKKKSERDRKVDENNQDVFVDVEKIKVKPFGGKKKVRVDRYDDRKNRKQRAMIVQFSALGLLVIILLLGFKNAIFPPESLSENDVAGIVAAQTGQTDFPIERGKGFVTDFMDAFLTVNPDVSSSHSKVLGYFYSGNPDSINDSGSYMSSSNAIQTILYGPTVYQEEALSDNSARYLVGAFVRQFTPNEGEVSEADKSLLKTFNVNGTNYTALDAVEHWMFFRIDVFYDPKVDGMAIAPDSPTLVPNVSILPISDAPEAAPIGDGEYSEELQTSLSTIVIEFLKAYRQSSPENYSYLEQYVVKNPPLSLKTGLNSEVEFNGEPETAISFVAAKSSKPGEFRVKATVEWASQVTDNSKISFVSTYFISLKQNSSGGYLVSNIDSMPYVINDKWLMENSDQPVDEEDEEEIIVEDEDGTEASETNEKIEDEITEE